MVSTTPGGISLRGLRLGVSTAATQIEGDCTNTNWMRWYEAGRVADNSSPDVTTRHYRKVVEDADLLVELGVRDYRMGVEWGRIEPREGEFDEAALAHYRDELTCLRERGITPLVTLHHFSNPLWFEDKGAWLADDAVEVFVRFATVVVDALGDLVDDWITINEPNVVASNGYVFGVFPPGRSGKLAEAFRVMDHMTAAHVACYQLIHARNPQARVGVANHLRVFAPAHRWNPLEKAFSCLIAWIFQGAVTHAMCTGRFWPPLRRPGRRRVKPGRYYDFLGLNYYTRSFVALDNPDHVPDGSPVQDLGWEVHPAGIAQLARSLHRRYGAPVWVTENGTCDVDDAWRARYIWEHLEALVGSGVPVERYYHWCFVDNWEWSEGNEAKFGIVANDVATQARTLKDSGRFYADVIKAGALTPQAYERYVAHQEYKTK